MATGPTDWERQNQNRAASAFDRARSLQAEKSGSQQVKETALKADGPKPPGHVRNAVDAQIHREKMGRDDKAAKTARAQELQKGAIEKQAKQQPDKSKGEKER